MTDNYSINRIKFGLGLTTLATIFLELTLVRTFDVILNSIMGYMVITAAMFALGLGGIYVYKLKKEKSEHITLLPKLLSGYAVLTMLLLPVFNYLPFDMNFAGETSTQVIAWTLMYLMLILPFFIGGIVISLIFSILPSESHSLYFYDLLGAGIGCIILIPLIPYYGPGGLLFVVASILLLTAFLFSRLRLKHLLWFAPILIIFALFPLTLDNYIEFKGHGNKRHIDEYIAGGLREYVRWDPVSKLGVYSISPNYKYFALDGGQQASWLGAFNGNYEQYQKDIKNNPDTYYYGLSSGVHYFKRNTDADVLILGAAVGNETRVSLIFGARHVDSIELVGAMVDAAKGRFAEYNGNSFNHPKVNYRVGEGRTFLRSSKKKYDIIQMFSNHTSSSIAEGSGALGAAYLQTTQAYLEYFTHLKEDGVLSINRHIYPRMLTTAAAAWGQSGRKDFARHVLVIERWRPDTLPTMLIKMAPWTGDEVDSVFNYLNREKEKKRTHVASQLPSDKIYKDYPQKFALLSGVDDMRGVSIYIGTHLQKHLDYPVTVKLSNKDGNEVASSTIPGTAIEDNKLAYFPFPPIGNSKNKHYVVEITSPNPDKSKGFSVYLDNVRTAVMQTIPPTYLGEYHIAFNPLFPDLNLIPERLLQQPFPKDLASEATARLEPATDDKPHFNMTRKSFSKINWATAKYIDLNTIETLNSQVLPFLSSDVIYFFVVGVVSIFFALIFVFVPLAGSSLRKVTFNKMRWYLVYFSCLGAGFIIIELTFIQIFSKMIGFPTHTYATVLFTLLFGAATGSLASKKLKLNQGKKWNSIFILIVVCGLLFIMNYQTIFSQLLEYTLTYRILGAVAIIFPMGFFMGMPFPLGMQRLGSIEASGIPWAWGMNGFFTVFGGFLGLILSFFFGFNITLTTALCIYILAWFSFKKAITGYTV